MWTRVVGTDARDLKVMGSNHCWYYKVSFISEKKSKENDRPLACTEFLSNEVIQ